MPSSPLARLEAPVQVLLRVVAGAMFATHGVQKLFGLLGGHQVPLASQLGLGAVLELTCGTAIALGLFMPWAAVLASGMMAVAYVQFHWKLQSGAAFFPAVNKGELAVLYSLLFLYLSARGPGPAALGAVVGRRRG